MSELCNYMHSYSTSTTITKTTPLNHGHKPSSLQDELDKYDFTIRVLMAMLRKLRASAQIKANVFRSLYKKDQTVLQILLAKVQLPQEFILDGYVCGEDGLISQVDTHPAPADLGMVVFQPDKVKKGKCGKDCGLPALSEIFGKITGKTVEEPNVENKECVQVQKKVPAEEPPQAPKHVRLPSSQALKKGSKSIQDVLDLALGHIPLESKKAAPKEKAKAKAKGNTKAQPKNAAAKTK